MATIEPAHFVGSERVTPDGYILEPTTVWERVRLWWMCRRGEVLFLGVVHGVPTYLVLRSMLNRSL